MEIITNNQEGRRRFLDLINEGCKVVKVGNIYYIVKDKECKAELSDKISAEVIKRSILKKDVVKK